MRQDGPSVLIHVSCVYREGSECMENGSKAWPLSFFAPLLWTAWSNPSTSNEPGWGKKSLKWWVPSPPTLYIPVFIKVHYSLHMYRKTHEQIHMASPVLLPRLLWTLEVKHWDFCTVCIPFWPSRYSPLPCSITPPPLISLHHLWLEKNK